MRERIVADMLVAGLLLWSAMQIASSAETIISVKIVKQTAGRCTAPAELSLIAHGTGWEVMTGEAFHGENDWEIYWNIKHSQAQPQLPRAAARAPGVKVTRVIVGRTDVEHETQGDTVVFDLVNDRSRGQLIQTVLPDPEGGLPIDLHHNWEMRRAGKYATGEWPAAKIAAHNNYLFAAREALKIMGGFGPRPQDNPFDGVIVLEGCETAFTRGHADFPLHFHIMLYPPGYQGAQVPHFYLDDEGEVASNSFVAIGVPHSGYEYRAGEWCSLKDLHGKVGLELMITPEGGLLLRKGPGQPEYLLAADPELGAPRAVCVSRDGQTLVRAAATDDAAKGHMAIKLEYFEGGKIIRTATDSFDYDPFTGSMIRRQ